MFFSSHVDAFAFYNTYASIVGFSAKKAGNYHCRVAGSSKITRYTYKCNRAGKIVDRLLNRESRKNSRIECRKLG